MMLQLNLKIRCEAEKIEQSGRWIGECKSLGIVVEGDSLDDVHNATDEAIDLLFADLVEDGELEEFLADRGWSLNEPIPDAVSEGVSVSVPWELIARGGARDIQRSTA